MSHNLHDKDKKIYWLTSQVELAVFDYYDGVTEGLDRTNIVDACIVIEVQPGTYLDMLIDAHPDGRLWIFELDEPHSWRGNIFSNFTIISTPWEELEVVRPISMVIAHHLYQRGW